MFKSVILAAMLAVATSAVAKAESLVIGPQLRLPEVQAIQTLNETPYMLRSNDGEVRVLIQKNVVGVETLVGLLTAANGQTFFLERNDQKTMTLVVRQ